MKNIFKPILMMAAFAAMLTITSCEKTCDAGYEGSDCKTQIRTKYYGTYKVSGTAVNGGGSATITDLLVTVSASSTTNVQDFNITFVLGGDSYLLKGTLKDGSAFTVPSQTANGNTYTGSGSFAGSVTMNLSLAEDNSGTVTNVTLSGDKQ